jgi:hypothetical protein
MNSPDPDPLKLEDIDRDIRLEKLRRRIEEVAGGEVQFGRVADCDPRVEEAFLEHVLALESQTLVRPFDILQQEGFQFPAPEALDEVMLTAKLGELIHVLAAHRLYLHSTDHLSDRELYAWLWHEALREEFMGFGQPPGDCHLDVLGRCGEEDMILSLRYYADDDERARWADEFPDFPMPPREKPPFDRDRHLPQSDPPA